MSSTVFLQPLTASGRGAVAVIRWGSRDVAQHKTLDRHFRSASGKLASEAPVGRIMYGHWGAEDLVVVRVSDSLWEINCHGGDAAVSRIVADLGATTSTAIRSRLDEALLRQLLRCRTKQTAAYLLSQLQGALADFLQTLAAAENFQEAQKRIGTFLQREAFARHLVTPWKVAVVGLPNAGKSSLMNAVLGYQRSIVFDQPGTTRDLVEADVTIDGWPFVFIDTAGVRDDATDEIELVGVAAAKLSISESDVCVLVTDTSTGWTSGDEALLAEIRGRKPFCIAGNKVDLAPLPVPASEKMCPVFSTSAVTGQGIRELLDWIAGSAVPAPPNHCEPLPVISELNVELKLAVESEEPDTLKQTIERWLNPPFADSNN